LIEAT